MFIDEFVDFFTTDDIEYVKKIIIKTNIQTTWF